MELLSNLLKCWLPPKIDPNQDCVYIMNKGMKQLDRVYKAHELSCPLCGGKDAFFIPSDLIWSCLNEDCIYANDILWDPTKWWRWRNKLGLDNHEKPTEKLRLEQIGVEPEHCMANLQNCSQGPAIIVQLQKFSMVPNGFLVLAGTNGTGKTYAACACLQAAIDSGIRSVRFISIVDLRYKWKDCIGGNGRDLTIVDTFVDYKLLVIDDLGTSTPTDAFIDLLYMIIDKRKSRGKGTIITTNMSSKEMSEKFGNAIVSRITSGKFFKFIGDDRRMISF